MSTPADVDEVVEEHSRPKKVTRINKGSKEKAELLALFESKRWLLLPLKDPDLDALMLLRGYNRGQISRPFLVWRRLGDNAILTLSVLSIDAYKQSLEDRSDNAPELIKSTLATHVLSKCESTWNTINQQWRSCSILVSGRLFE
jgi:hypothetical protein